MVACWEEFARIQLSAARSEWVDSGPVGLVASEDQDEESVQCRERKESSKGSEDSFPEPITPVGVFACRVPPCGRDADSNAASSGSKTSEHQGRSPGVPGMAMNTRQAFCLLIDRSYCLMFW